MKDLAARQVAFMPFSKADGGGKFKKNDDGHMIVPGVVSSEVIDLQGDFVELKAVKDAFDDHYMPIGNIRFQHDDKKPVGKVQSFDFAKGQAIIDGKIVNQEAQELIDTGVLNGYSMLGEILEYRMEKNAATGRQYRRVTKIRLDEISVVDRPANQEALFFGKSATCTNEKEWNDTMIKKDEVTEVPPEEEKKIKKAAASQKLLERVLKLRKAAKKADDTSGDESEIPVSDITDCITDLQGIRNTLELASYDGAADDAAMVSTCIGLLMQILAPDGQDVITDNDADDGSTAADDSGSTDFSASLKGGKMSKAGAMLSGQNLTDIKAIIATGAGLLHRANVPEGAKVLEAIGSGTASNGNPTGPQNAPAVATAKTVVPVESESAMSKSLDLMSKSLEEKFNQILAGQKEIDERLKVVEDTSDNRVISKRAQPNGGTEEDARPAYTKDELERLIRLESNQIVKAQYMHDLVAMDRRSR